MVDEESLNMSRLNELKRLALLLEHTKALEAFVRHNLVCGRVGAGKDGSAHQICSLIKEYASSEDQGDASSEHDVRLITQLRY